MKNYINLKEHYNARMIFPKETPLDTLGIYDHMYFPQEDFAKYDKIVSSEKHEFMLSNNEKLFDCVRCLGQTIRIQGEMSGNRISFLGFGAWGGFQDIFEIEYDDGTAEELKVHLYDTGIDYET